MKRLQRTMYAFTAITVFVYVAGVVYHYFGRGVFSLYMDHAFYYPLFLGLVLNILLMPIQQRIPFTGTVGYRLYSNIFNAGIASLTVYSFIMGILDIANTDSKWLVAFLYIGIACVVIGLLILGVLILMSRNARNRSSRSRR